MVLTAGSKLHIGRTGLEWAIAPEGRLRWYLYDSNGDIAAFKNVEKLHHTSPNTGWVDDPDFVVPAFSATGGWRATLVVKGPFFGIIEKNIISYLFNVGESSLMDNIFAPFYITWGGIPAVKWGEFHIALPCLFLLSSPFWGFALFVVALIIWKRSFRLAGSDLKKGMIEIRKRFKKKGGKKDVKKTKIKKSAG